MCTYRYFDRYNDVHVSVNIDGSDYCPTPPTMKSLYLYAEMPTFQMLK